VSGEAGEDLSEGCPSGFRCLEGRGIIGGFSDDTNDLVK
jgi:hypothetical protein